MHPPHRRTALLALATTLGLLVAGCGSAESATSGASSSGAGGGQLSIVTTTNVYAAIARAVAGDRARVTAILDDPSADPHSFEATPADQVAIGKANVVIANGGGYDDFAMKMVEAAPSHPALLDAVEISGLDAGGHPHASADAASGAGEPAGHDHGVFNEHVFYSYPAMAKLANALADKLSADDPAGAAAFRKNAASFTAGLDKLTAQATDVGKKYPGRRAVVTEPVAGYLLDTIGIADATPESFAEAVEEENDPSVKDVAAVSDLLKQHQVSLLVYNDQTSGPVTDQVQRTAESAGIPVAPVSETLPPGVDSYLTWQQRTIGGLASALAAAPEAGR
ncbi:metal ABC transporter solute-binding protein, Zn/Mn family [Nakamurella aerolata]|uniref:Zinc ABC transporter solute-binding protein n=1 Tax=Nakamurella aerolata TaxID=1656892 RepID=A0A849A7L8_9ACTN|nr:zinc ABC transporter solute-binding protein [Nakamurella aerolata]